MGSQDSSVPPDVSQRISSRLRLYMAALEIAHTAPDCTKVEQVGTVAVPVKLIRNLQDAVDGYVPETPRVREYRP